MPRIPSPVGFRLVQATWAAALLGLLLAGGEVAPAPVSMLLADANGPVADANGQERTPLLAQDQPAAPNAAAPSGAGPERLPVRLLAEAEDFTIKSGWEIVPYRENYFACTFAITFLSRMACLGAPEQLPPGQTAIAEQTIHVPYEDTYELLVRYEQPYDFSCEFTVEVKQKGKVVARWDCGRLQDPKIWAFNNHKREPMVRYGWSATDNIVWQHPGQVRLEGGAATLRLLATAQLEGGRPRRQAARRHVDVVCLTNDRTGMERQKKTGYLEFDGWLVQEGDLFLRITNPADAPAPVAVTLPPMQAQHSPYWVHVRDWPTTLVLRQGRAVTETAYQLAGPRSQQVRPEHLAPLLPWPKVIPEEQYLRPGDRSGWVPLGQACDALNTGQWAAQVQYFRPPAKGSVPKGSKPAQGGNPKGKEAQEIYLRYEFGVPDGQGGIRVIKDVTVRAPLAERTAYTFDIPGCVHPNPTLASILKQRYWLPRIRTQKETLANLLAEVKKFPPVGRVPERLLIYGISAGDSEEGRQLALALGDNTTVGGQGKKRGLIAHWGNTDLQWIEQQVAKRPGGFSDVLIVSYGDEIHLPADKMTDAEFAAWLQARGIQYDGPIRFTTDRNDPLFYYSQLAAKEKGGARYAAATAYYKTHGVLTGANYSPHANYLVTEIDYIRPFKLRAMSMPWTEDYAWQVAEFSPQVVGYLLSGLRAGAKYDRLPIHMYVMPHSPGQIPSEFRQSFYCSIAHGAKIINYFTATPLSVAYTENYVDTEDLAMWRMIHRCTHEAGIFEDYVVDGWVRPGRVGLLLSSVDELITGVNNFSLALHNNERKALYFALRHAQVPVDFLSEDDIIEGRAQDYAVIYVTQQYLHSRCLAALQKWVEAGGTLVALCGGGFRNEFQKDNPAAAVLYGVESGPIQTDPALVPRYLQGNANTPFFAKQDLPRYEPWDYASWDGSLFRGKAEGGKTDAGKADAGAGGPGETHRRVEKVPVVAWKQPLTVKTAQVAGRFRDGTPAVTVQRHGRGRAVLFAFLPGQAYLRSGLPLRPVDRGASPQSYAHFLPTQLDRHLRARLVEDFLPSDDARLRPVLVEAELVETTCIDTPALQGQPARLAIPLINWSGRPIPQLNVLLRDLPAVRRIRSVERGELQYTQTPEGLRLSLPLDAADMLLIDR